MYLDTQYKGACETNVQCEDACGGSACTQGDGIVTKSVRGQICTCKRGLVPVNFASNLTRCLSPARHGQRCTATGQCSAIDKSTYCTFQQVCECRDGVRCRSNNFVTCNNDEECLPIEFCSYGTCKPKKGINDKCSNGDECLKNDSNSICSGGVCKCADNFKATRRGKCIASDKCITNDDCDLTGSYCQGGVCVSGTSLGQPCSRQSACRAADPDSICSCEYQ